MQPLARLNVKLEGANYRDAHASHFCRTLATGAPSERGQTCPLWGGPIRKGGQDCPRSDKMLTEELNRTVLELPAEERIELARRLVESVVWPAAMNEAVIVGIRRIEDVPRAAPRA